LCIFALHKLQTLRLTTLEIKGFKSFADKTTIHINQDITGVVGPNGSGKSNVVDAIRWVLGEQRTSQLRSEKMDNLIFNGSRNRKPSGLAEVSLSFDNTKGVLPSEYSNVTITRQLNRSGESEYRLNNVTCRLKDITGLFLDTGITSDSYAIIELGMIDEILNDRDNSRRKLFEQAAGISKFKTRKKETLSKLTATDGDLARVEDLLFEIGNNLKMLESQARKAEKYYKMKEEYKELTLELSKFQVQRYVSSFKDLKIQSEEQESRAQGIEQKIAALEAELEKEKTALLEKEKNLTERQKRLNEILAVFSKKENDRNIAVEQVKYLKEKKENIRVQIENAALQLEKVTAQLNSVNDRIVKQNDSVEQLKTEVESLNQNVSGFRGNHDNLKQEVDTLIKERAESDKKIYELEKKISISNNQKENLLKIIEQHKNENASREIRLAELKAEYQTNEAEQKQIAQQLEELNKQETEWQQRVEKLQLDIEQLKHKLASENRLLDAKTNEYNLNKSLIDNLEGYPESIKFLKKNAKSLKTKEAPLLSDVIYCKEEYRVAIENYLEPYLNYFVLDEKDSAYESVHLLSDSGKGRANFFILADFQNFFPKASANVENAIPAIQLVEVEERYKKLVSFLLENTFVTNDEIFRDSDSNTPLNSVVLLSKSGKYARTGYSLSGGSVGLFEGMRIGRIKNLEKLQKEMEELEEQKKKTEQLIQTKQQELNEVRNKTVRNQIQVSSQSLNQLNNKLASLTATIENTQSFVTENIRKNEEIIERIQNIEQELATAEAHLGDTITLRQTLDDKYFTVQKNFQEAAEQLNVNAAKYNERNIYFYQQQNLLSQLQQEEQYTEKQIEEINQRTTRNNEEITLAEQKLAEQSIVIEQLEKELAEYGSEQKGFETSLSEAEKIYYEARAVITDKEDTLKQEHKLKQNADVITNELREKNTELKILLSSLKERLSVEFNIGINDIIEQEPNPELNEDELKQKVQQIKERLERFGEVNPMAMEAYKEMKERHDFITAQRNDLLEAKNSLLATMNEIEMSAKDKFMDAFAQARENFIKVFRSLFTEEDNCDLRLQDTNNPLESKIEIIAQPKGKRPQVIDQLSGGEKTLTALAILFALYLLKPAPFCILDEVDAPLDDANIGKFNKMIREFSSNSQFILVTHNKSTMSAVDVIYGVTMQELGVSKVVPVDFRDLN
jgi:chromosome segregation protein